VLVQFEICNSIAKKRLKIGKALIRNFQEEILWNFLLKLRIVLS